jgi:hypothetical protein
MQQFVVPQFIDVEDKIIGPVTVRQFLIILGGAGLSFIAYKLADFTLFLLEFVIISFVSFSLAFIRVNGRPLHYLLLNVIQTARRPRVKVWNKHTEAHDTRTNHAPGITVSAPTAEKRFDTKMTRLAELALVVDTGGIYQGEDSKTFRSSL